ncbi:MAG: hypothetical protein K6E98_12315 [Lachnospiraceae bacterium]|nr:hypothetical protein [Lachnospiraceae bacterium]
MDRLYETKSYLKEYVTLIEESGYDEKNRPYVELRETVFFPNEGGQNADTGELTVLNTDGANGEKEDDIINVRIIDGIISGRQTCSGKSGGSFKIRYIVSRPLKKGMMVLCRLDWDKRYDRMQNHSGEHILTGVIHNKYGYDNVGFHLSDTDFVTLDINGIISYEEVLESEMEANRVIYANMPVRDSYPDKKELMNIDYRSKIEIDDQVRLITIGDEESTVDVCACCAPHVRRTGEIGIIKVISVTRHKGGTQIVILCGRRALEYINRELDILKRTANILSTETVNIPDRVESYRKEIYDLKGKFNHLSKSSLIEKINSVADDSMRCVFVKEEYPVVVIQEIYNALTVKYDGYVGVFTGDDDNGYRYNAGSLKEDSLELAKIFEDRFGAKGGGNADMIRGKVMASKEDIIKIFKMSG